MALLMFTGDECPHCHDMEPFIVRLEEEEGLVIKKLEVWHNAKNAHRLQELDDGLCGGVPFFYNEETHESLCGAVPYEKFKAWATKKKLE